ncbi:hypothetical protein CAPTEDRAFT_154025 [Capitella teleta]|uniref:Protein rolling stone n=1 Tax=Capitella teleta TaxID=283909 RepID=R7U754_CAPTE|nr:hypothetical protein CAPTEDRAFT_154025 [Capitella teleta]|eukprot:ELT99506.1 hypothetical protein CAPTEDRAFT_154025 [Capitella teleta]
MAQMIKTLLLGLREELTSANLWFKHDQPRRLLEPQWGGRSLGYVAYRIAIALYFTIVILYDGVSYAYGWKWFIFLTDWFYILLTFQALFLGFAVTFHYERAKRATPGESIYGSLAWPLQLIWFLQNLILSGAVLITLVYWGWAIYEEVDKKIDLPNVTAHGLITLYVLTDSFIVGIPVRLLHFYQPPILGVSYATFSWVYWMCGGTDPEGRSYVYSVLDFSSSPTVCIGYICMLVVFSMFLHLCMFGLCKVRMIMCESTCCHVLCCMDDAQEATPPVMLTAMTAKDSLVDLVVIDSNEEPAKKSLLNVSEV